MDHTSETGQGFGPCPLQAEGMTHLITVREKLKKAAAQRRDGRRAVLQNKHDPAVRRRSQQVGAALGDAVLGLMPLPSREVGKLSQANWLLQEVTSR